MLRGVLAQNELLSVGPEWGRSNRLSGVDLSRTEYERQRVKDVVLRGFGR